ncbi:MAG TPA: MBL fold metallo-hydrolase [bacterium]|nr:MBL fold metallo-hydrolase [bacterium]
MFTYDQKGIQIAGAELWLDALRKVSFSFVSHGHTDHLKNHTRILATPATACFHALRAKKAEVQTLNFGETLEMAGMRIRLYPAGHILGSAMIHIERDGLSLLYSGDFKLRPSATCEPIETPHADILITESTFGHPQYVVEQSREALIAELTGFIRDAQRAGYTPVVMAYTLGKSQEAMKILGDLGYPVRVYPSIWQMAEVYQQFGVKFNNCAVWQGAGIGAEEVLIVPPHVAFTRALQFVPRRKTVFLSGWANGSQGPGWRCDHRIPLSDHADFHELIEFVGRVQPQKIYTTHGFAEFPGHLCELGYNAEILA